jgi:hypothetical protein
LKIASYLWLLRVARPLSIRYSQTSHDTRLGNATGLHHERLYVQPPSRRRRTRTLSLARVNVVSLSVKRFRQSRISTTLCLRPQRQTAACPPRSGRSWQAHQHIWGVEEYANGNGVAVRVQRWKHSGILP